MHAGTHPPSSLELRTGGQSPAKNPPRIKTASIHAAPTTRSWWTVHRPRHQLCSAAAQRKSPLVVQENSDAQLPVLKYFNEDLAQQNSFLQNETQGSGVQPTNAGQVHLKFCSVARSPWMSGFGESAFYKDHPVECTRIDCAWLWYLHVKLRIFAYQLHVDIDSYCDHSSSCQCFLQNLACKISKKT